MTSREPFRAAVGQRGGGGGGTSITDGSRICQYFLQPHHGCFCCWWSDGAELLMGSGWGFWVVSGETRTEFAYVTRHWTDFQLLFVTATAALSSSSADVSTLLLLLARTFLPLCQQRQPSPSPPLHTVRPSVHIHMPCCPSPSRISRNLGQQFVIFQFSLRIDFCVSWMNYPFDDEEEEEKRRWIEVE